MKPLKKNMLRSKTKKTLSMTKLIILEINSTGWSLKTSKSVFHKLQDAQYGY